MPSAPAAFNCGIISRTMCSSMIVSTATQPLRLKLEMVGLRRAGRLFKRLARFFSAMFIFKPTLVSASSAPLRSMAMVSIFFPLPVVIPRCVVGDEARRGAEQFIHDAQFVRLERRTGLGDFDDGVDEFVGFDLGGAP